MGCNCNVKGFIVGINPKSGTAQVKGEDGTLYQNVLLINPFGTHSIPQITNNTAIIIFKSLGSKEATYGMPFNYIKQYEKLPIQSEGDYAIGSLVGGNNIIFQADGNTIENAKTKTVNAETNINGKFTTNDITELGDAVANVLNESAIILDSLGQPCTISNAGQSKVKA